ncbi:MAG: transposase [Rubrivivax sp.]
MLADGTPDVLGLWIENTEVPPSYPARSKVFNDRQDARRERHPDRRHRWAQGHRRGARGGVPATTLQTCIVHLIRSSLEYASWKDRKQLAAALRPVYTALLAQAAEAALAEFERGAWGRRHPNVAAAWRRAWERVIGSLPPAGGARLVKLIYTTNAHRELAQPCARSYDARSLPLRDDAATKLIWLALCNIAHDRIPNGA